MRWGAFAVLMLTIGIAEVIFFTVWDPSGRTWSARGNVAVHQPTTLTGVTLGALLFRESRCADCHGVAGVGGVPNPNYLRGSAPALNVMAERLMLFDARTLRGSSRAFRRVRTPPPDPSVGGGSAGSLMVDAKYTCRYALVYEVYDDANERGPR